MNADARILIMGIAYLLWADEGFGEHTLSRTAFEGGRLSEDEAFRRGDARFLAGRRG
jgi:hypothetical protein